MTTMKCPFLLTPRLQPGGKQTQHLANRFNGLSLNVPARPWILALAAFLMVGPWNLKLALAAEPARITIKADAPGARINPTMWGIFFEDINFGADGGLYAELVKNRGFEFPDPTTGWTKLSPGIARGRLSILDENPFSKSNARYLRIESEGKAPFGVFNEGFRGIGMRKEEFYDFSAWIRPAGGSPILRLELYSANGAVLDTVRLTNFSPGWKKYTAVLHPNDTDARAKLYVLLEGKGGLDFDMISLFPEHTWKNRPGGLRADMVRMLANLKPGFMRFPGGCIVEGSELSRRYQWKKTIGPVEERQLLINRWNYEFLHRPASDYFQSFGLGFFEFFQLCEDIGAEPLPILNCGMACQFNTGELCPMDQLDTYIQDALDLIEFANGPANSTWGAKRAEFGHPEPFNMKLLGVGNEQWEQQYIERYTKFHQALKAKYPEIQLVSSAGPSPDDSRFNFAWPKLRQLHADIVDEHCYANPDWFFKNTHRYDAYDPTGPKVFMGEYAAQSDKVVSVKNRNNLECALAEAAYMTGLERNADVVRMASYAPLFAHIDAWQWTPNLIWTDNLRVYGTPNYYVQQLFSLNRGDAVLPLKLDCPSDGKTEPKLYASAVFDETARQVILKIVNAEGAPRDVEIQMDGVGSVRPDAKSTLLTSDKLADENSLDAPTKVSPRSVTVELSSTTFRQTVPAHAFMVLRVGV